METSNEESAFKHQPTKKDTQRVSYLWDELPAEEKERLLRQTAAKLKTREAVAARQRELAEQEDKFKLQEVENPAQVRKAGKHLLKYIPEEYSNDLAEFWEEVCGLNLDDGWLRMCCLHRLLGLHIFIRERYAEGWLGYTFSKQVKATQGMKVWPRRARSKANPFKWAAIHEVQLCKVKWHEELDQYEVQMVFEGDGVSDQRRRRKCKSKVTQTYWFKAEFQDSGMGEGWVRPTATSLGKPL